jgi:hypothetical protein
MHLRLRPFKITEEPVAVAAHDELAKEHFPFLLGWDPGRPWAAHIQTLEDVRDDPDGPPKRRYWIR